MSESVDEIINSKDDAGPTGAVHGTINVSLNTFGALYFICQDDLRSMLDSLNNAGAAS